MKITFLLRCMLPSCLTQPLSGTVISDCYIFIFFCVDRNKGKCLNTSPLLTLLRDVNDQLQTHAKAAGLLESQQEKGKLFFPSDFEVTFQDTAL